MLRYVLRTYIQRGLVLCLLLVYYTQSEVDFVGLLEVWGHSHDLRESFFGMFQRSIAIIQDAYSVP
jgi:hypothetical protein